MTDATYNPITGTYREDGKVTLTKPWPRRKIQAYRRANKPQPVHLYTLGRYFPNLLHDQAPLDIHPGFTYDVAIGSSLRQLREGRTTDVNNYKARLHAAIRTRIKQRYSQPNSTTPNLDRYCEEGWHKYQWYNSVGVSHCSHCPFTEY